MNITFERVIDIVENGLTKAEINSFKHGNTPSEENRIAGVIQNIWPYCKYCNTTRHEALMAAYMIVDQAPNIEVLERKAASICGQWAGYVFKEPTPERDISIGGHLSYGDQFKY